MINVGVIGAGRIGKIHIENLLRNVAGVKLKIVADVMVNDELKQWATSMGVPKLVSDAKEVFNDPEIDVVVICSSTDTHAKFIQESAKAKKQIFCEKPIDVDLGRIKETLSIVKEAGVKLMIGFNRRFDRNFKRVQEVVASGKIGEPHIVKITARDPAPPPIDYIKVSGGIFLDMTIHDWDMARFQARSEVDEVYAVFEVKDLNGQVLLVNLKVDQFYILLPGGHTAIIDHLVYIQGDLIPVLLQGGQLKEIGSGCFGDIRLVMNLSIDVHLRKVVFIEGLFPELVF